jgi:hypothetical protein
VAKPGRPGPKASEKAPRVKRPAASEPKPAEVAGNAAADGPAASAAGPAGNKPADALRPAAAGPARTKAAEKPSPPKGPRTKRSNTGAKLPTAWDPEYERPLSELPPLTFPNSEEYEFRLIADQRRKVRVRNESIFGAVLVLIGLLVLVAARSPAFLGLAVIAGGAMAAYELIISGLE